MADRAGLVGPELDYAVKKYKGHRIIPRENLEIIQSEFKKQQDDKLKATFIMFKISTVN